MVIVLILNDEKSSLGKEIYSVLSENNLCMLVSGNCVLTNSEVPDILLVEKNKYSSIDLSSYILVLGKITRTTTFSNFSNCHTVIVSSDNKKALKLAKELNSQILVCGMSVRDTVSLTSVVGENATVSINRCITDLHYNNVDECELLIPNNNCSKFSLMCAGVIDLL